MVAGVNSRTGTVLLGCVLLLGCAPGEPPPIRVTIIGVDGATWQVIDPLLAQGALPNLAGLLARGVRAPLRSRVPLVSPPVWTTIATGKLRAEHGIKEFHTKGALVSSRDRRVPALWNLLSRAGRRVAVIGWWATYPAEHVDGVIISERALKTREADIKALFRRRLQPSQATALAYPPETLDLLAAQLGDAPHLDGVDERGKTIETMRVEDAAVTHALLALRAQGRPFDLEMILLRGVDPVSHFFWKYLEPDDPAYAAAERPTPEEVAQYANVIPDHYRWVDGLIGELVADDPSRVFVILSDHGFEAGHQRFHTGTILSGTHKTEAAQDGVLVLAGGPIRRGAKLDGSAIEDVAPTVLHLLGLQVARDFAGRVLEEAIDDDWVATHPIAWIDAYPGPAGDLPEAREPSDPAVDERLREELRALGYIE
jgi:predicted AlkP superfamily phosphohydrolase/phosphomutase